MTVFLDTSVLVPVFVADHPQHDVCIRLFSPCEPESSSCAAHSLAEVYSTLTRLPAPHRATPEQGIRCVEEIAKRLRVVSLDGEAYLAALRSAAARGIAGGTIYDALLAECARQVDAERIYTWNLRHFERLGADLAARLMTPGA